MASTRQDKPIMTPFQAIRLEEALLKAYWPNKGEPKVVANWLSKTTTYRYEVTGDREQGWVIALTDESKERIRRWIREGDLRRSERYSD